MKRPILGCVLSTLILGACATAPASIGTRDAGSHTPRDSSAPTIGDDAGNEPTPIDVPDTGAPVPLTDAGNAPSPAPPPAAECVVAAHRLWSDDFETGDNRNWTGRGYGEPWGNECETTMISTEMPRPGGGTYVQRSDNTCRSIEDVHRGYGGLQFSGETVLPAHTNTGVGFEAPNGMVSTSWVWLDAGYSFGGGRWVNFFSVFPNCEYNERMITLGIDNADGILRPAHYWPEGTLEMSPDAPRMPLGRWVRITTYLNYESGQMHVWQDGASVSHVRGIVRSSHRMCQFHWGLYSSGDNDDILMYEDDKSVWKLDEQLTDFTQEPRLDVPGAACER